ncbi:NAD(P)-dependent oxidoreductase [Campylobacter lari]|uniref:NAD-dependent epimerase/dehydratase family protein n=1 Tax=Campylobacter lari TaxID=201 RepID=UPI0008D438FF|nr:NAD(P)-dependent oxidoreductase [Campylobacter lari]EAI4813042.1 NAD(P)-dependent oxidoreductase [Campylobacter lari]EAI4842170.1 NAD(P)-dependent oxidoreductase [Campylobacter lari]EAI9744242.1 NAD(P)-dependent oxidoreductase [Campylobacter lari]EAJ0334523.1 NAD(P)-dependent oxidoreductase [Campylobacter lari]EAJ0342389.1 NAD(P)-dependent oxidoreductase [Campylobacter lari]
MKILVTGATGFIGTNFILQMHDRYEIVALVRKNSNIDKIRDYCKICYYEDFAVLKENLQKEQIDGVLHLATLYLKHHRSEDLKDLIDSNILFGVELLEILYLIGFSGWFINIGTFWQFYQNLSNNPLNLYAATKTAFLNIANYYIQIAKYKFVTILLNDTYGPNDWRPKIINLWKKSLETKEVIRMSGGEQIIDMLYIDDVINAFEKCINNFENKKNINNTIYALHSKERITLKQLSNIFEECVQEKLNIIWGVLPYSNRENFIPFEGGEKLPNWEQNISLREGFLKILC